MTRPPPPQDPRSEPCPLCAEPCYEGFTHTGQRVLLDRKAHVYALAVISSSMTLVRTDMAMVDHDAVCQGQRG